MSHLAERPPDIRRVELRADTRGEDQAGFTPPVAGNQPVVLLDRLGQVLRVVLEGDVDS